MTSQIVSIHFLTSVKPLHTVATLESGILFAQYLHRDHSTQPGGFLSVQWPASACWPLSHATARSKLNASTPASSVGSVPGSPTNSVGFASGRHGQRLAACQNREPGLKTLSHSIDCIQLSLSRLFSWRGNKSESQAEVLSARQRQQEYSPPPQLSDQQSELFLYH